MKKNSASSPDAAPPRHLVLDFDSTFVSVETLDELAKAALDGRPDREQVLAEVTDITRLGMEGKIPISKSLRRRLKLFAATREHVDAVVARLRSHVTESIRRNRRFFEQHGAGVYVVSNGFKEFIVPVVTEFGIPERNVLAGNFRFDAKGRVRGVDEKSTLAKDGGKARAVSQLGLRGEVVVVGDGMTDYEIKEAGAAQTFVAFTENVTRPAVVAKADAVARTFDDVVRTFAPRAGAGPRRGGMKILLLENIHALAAKHLRDAGHDVELLDRALPETELAKKLAGVSLLGIRSNTHVTGAALEGASDLLAIGAFCIGTNAIDLSAATQRGIAVFNAPYSNGRSVVEMAIGLVVMLFRRIPDKAAQMHAGRWDKSAKGSHEIRGKTLGIVGYGNIGTQLSVVAESLGMEVRFHDVLERPSIGNAKRCDTLDELLATSDVVTVHVDGRPVNRGFLGAEQFARMKRGAMLLNLSRGFVLDVDALARALESGHLGGAAVDVFPQEPRENPAAFDSPLRGLPNVILTPHVGGSTQEAQEGIARFMAGKLTSFVDTGSTMLSVNFPGLQLPALNDAHRLIHVHANRPGVLAKINGLMSRHRMNILGQYLGTTGDIGYVITDVNKEYDREILERLRKMPETLRVRMLY